MVIKNQGALKNLLIVLKLVLDNFPHDKNHDSSPIVNGGFFILRNCEFY